MTEEMNTAPPANPPTPPSDLRRDWIPVDQEGRLQKEFWCAKCDHELMGEKACGTCPECGTPVATALAGEPVCHADENGRILEHIACATCHHDLAGLPVESQCPECGAPGQFSLGLGLLRYGDPKWLRTVRDGFLWFIIVIFVALVMNVGAGVIAQFIQEPALKAALPIATGILVSVISLVTIWFITATDEFEKANKLGQLTRLFAVLSVLGAVISSVSIFKPSAQFIAALPAILLQVGFTVAFYTYLRNLALRIPDDKLAKHARIVLWGLAIAFSFLFLGMAVMVASGVDPVAIQQQSASGQPPQIQGTTMILLAVGGGITLCLGTFPMLVFQIWGIVLLFWFRSRFATAATLAELSSMNEPITSLE